MSIEISQETEARLAAEARRRGISVDALLARFIDEHAALTQPAPCRPMASRESITFNAADFAVFPELSILAP
jgi:hypothetical protein